MSTLARPLPNTMANCVWAKSVLSLWMNCRPLAFWYKPAVVG